MMRSLKIQINKQTRRIGSYQLRPSRKGWKVTGTGEQAGVEFSLRPVTQETWDLSAGASTSLSGRTRQRIDAASLDEAVEKAAAKLRQDPPVKTSSSAAQLRIADAFYRAIQAMGGGKSHREDLIRFSGYFIGWADEVRWFDEIGREHQGIHYWSEFTFELARRYQDDLLSGEATGKSLKRATVKHYLEPVRLTSRFCAGNWPGVYHDVTSMLRLPRRRFGKGKWIATQGKSALSFGELHEFVSWLRGHRHASVLVTAVLLMGYCGMRMMEALSLRWCDVDLEEGTATIEDVPDHEVKNDNSVRRIPLPAIVLAHLKTMKRRPGDAVVPYDSDFRAFGKMLARALKKWRPGILFAPKDLRASLMNDAQFKIERKDWNELLVRFYCGHAPRNEAEAHYCNQRKAFLTELWRTEVAEKVDELVDNCTCSACAKLCQNMSTEPEKSHSPQAKIIDIA